MKDIYDLSTKKLSKTLKKLIQRKGIKQTKNTLVDFKVSNAINELATLIKEEITRRQLKNSEYNHKYQRYYTCICPFHRENTPSFVVDAWSNSYYCFGCGKKGHIKDEAISRIKKIKELTLMN
jgi:hypothetical protein